MMGGVAGVGAPDAVQDLPMGEHLSGVGHEQAQQGVLDGGQVDDGSAASDDPRGEVDLDGATGEQGLGRSGEAASGGGTDAGQEFGAAEGLGDVVISTGVEGGDLVVLAVVDGEDHDGDGAPFADASEDGEAVEVREAEVEEDEVGPVLGGGEEPIAAVGGFEDTVGVTFEGDAQEAPDLRFVVDDEEREGTLAFGGGGRCGCGWHGKGGGSGRGWSRLVLREADDELGATGGPVGGGYGATVRLDEAADQGEAESTATGRRSGNAVESVKDPVEVIGWDPGTGIGDDEDEFVGFALGADLDGRARWCVCGGVREQVAEGVLDEGVIKARKYGPGRKIEGDRMLGEFASTLLEAPLHEVTDVVPVEAWAHLAGFESGGIQEVSNDAVQPGVGLLDFLEEGLALFGGIRRGVGEGGGGAGGGGERGAEFVRDGTQEGAAEAVGFGGEPRTFRCGPQVLAIQDEGGLPGEGFEQLTLRGGQRGLGDRDDKDADGPSLGDERQVEGAGAGKVVGGSARGSLLAEAPVGNAGFGFIQGEGAIRMGDQTVAGGEADGGGNAAGAVDAGDDLPDDLVAGAAFGERSGEVMEGGGALFAAAFGFALDADACDDLTEQKGDEELRAEQEDVLALLEMEGEARGEQEEIPRGGAKGSGEEDGSAADDEGRGHHGHEEAVAGDARTGPREQGKVEESGGGDDSGGNAVLGPGRARHRGSAGARAGFAGFDGANDVQVDVAALLDKTPEDASSGEPAERGRAPGFADDDLGDVVFAGDAEESAGEVVVGGRDREGAQGPCGLEVPGEAFLIGGRDRDGTFDMDREPRAPELVGASAGPAKEGFGMRAGAHRNEEAIAGLPGFMAGLRATESCRIVTDMIGDEAQGEFPKGGEVGLAEVPLGGGGGAFAGIDAAGPEAAEELGGGEVDEFKDGVVEDTVGDGFADLGAGDLADGVGPAFKVLDVDGGEDVDAGVEDLTDVLPAFGMAGAGGVGVGELVDEDEGGPAGEDAVEVHLAECDAAVVVLASGNGFETGGEGVGFGAAVGFNVADDDGAAGSGFAMGGLEHGVGLADARAHAEEDLEAAAALPRLRGMDGGQEGLRVAMGAGFQDSGFKISDPSLQFPDASLVRRRGRRHSVLVNGHWRLSP